MGGKIDGYLDCTSPYSYFAMLYLTKQRPLLAQYDIEVDPGYQQNQQLLTILIQIPSVFLGGINVGSGNKPPWTLPAKANYGPYDMKRAIKYFGTEKIASPPFFPILSIMPQRCMLYIKAHFPQSQYETTFLSLWTYSFVTHINISEPPNMIKLLSDASVGNNYTKSEIEAIMAAAKSQEYKDALTKNTEKALSLGAYGAPWFWMKNGKGEEEPLFGSDRWMYMWEFMGLEWQDVEILPKGKGKAKL